MTDKKTLPDLSGFTGSDTFYRHQLVPGVVYTQGVQHLAEAVGAYWLIDQIATNQMERTVENKPIACKSIAAVPFQVWILDVAGDATATLRLQDGNDNLLMSEDIPYTDFPEGRFTLWAVMGDVRCIMLPREY